MEFRTIPLPVLVTYKENRRKSDFSGAALSLDLVGFTTMCETLLPLGRSGEDTLAMELESLFAPMVVAVESHGGIIVNYAGDSFTAIFPENDNISPGNCVYLAIKTTEECLKWLSENGIRDTDAGEFNITARVGIAYGNIQVRLVEYVPDENSAGSGRLGFYFSGDAIGNCSIAQSNAPNGEANIFSGTPEEESCEAPEVQEYPQLDDEDFHRFLPNILVENPPRGESRRITSLYGRLARQLSDSEIQNSFSIVAEAEASFGGYFSGFLCDSHGWGFLVIFGAPEAHEDDITRALECAVFIRNKMSDIMDINAKLGVNLGEAYAGYTGGAGCVQYTCLGDTVNLSERLSRIALPGEIAVSMPINKRAHKYEFMDTGKYQIKGKSESVRVFKMIGRKIGRTLTSYDGKFCGRQYEIDKLKECAEVIFSNNFGGIVRIVGDAGTGKSRILFELRRRLENENKQFRWIYLPCDPINKNPLNPLLYMLKSRFPYTESRDIDEWKSRFKLAIDDFLHNPAISAKNRGELIRTYSIIGGYLGYRWENSLFEMLDARGKKENFLYAMKALVKAEAEIAPTIVEIEDVHWLDSETEKWLKILMRNAENVPFIVITTERPDDCGKAHEFGFDYGVNSNIISLGNLTRDGLCGMVSSEFGALPDEEFCRYLLDHTEGNPFFIEQFCRHFKDMNAIQIKDEKSCLISAPELLPPDAEAMLVARIDAMGAKVKDMLQRASILGMRFAIKILDKILSPNIELHPILMDAERFGAIYPDEAAELSELYYFFRHALLQETAYEMQLPSVRAELHNIALRIFESLYRNEKRGAYYMDMSRHAEKAKETEKFIEYTFEAANYAEENYNNEQAIMYYDKLLEHKLKPKYEAAIYIKKGTILNIIGKNNDAIANYKKGLLLYRKYNDDENVAKSLTQIGYCYAITGEYDKAMEFHEEALYMAKNTANKEIESEVLNNAATCLFRTGNYEESLKYLQKALKIGKHSDTRKTQGTTLNNMGLVYHNRGNFKEAMKYYNSARKIHHEIGKRRSEATAIGNIGIIHKNCGEYEKSKECQIEALRIHKEIGHKVGEGLALLNLGILYRTENDLFLAEKYYKNAIELFRETGDRVHECAVLANIGKIHMVKGEYARAMSYYEEALSLCRDVGDPYSEAVMLHNIGLLHMEQGHYKEAIESLNRSNKLCLKMKCEDGYAENNFCIASIYLKAENEQYKDRKKGEALLRKAYATFTRLTMDGIDDVIKMAQEQNIDLSD